jgi:Hydantoinase B/oxoprolinase
MKAATVGSNVETSQRIADVILKAFRVAGASQGTCNNLTFGHGGDGVVTRGFGYHYGGLQSNLQLPTQSAEILYGKRIYIPRYWAISVPR